MTVIDILARTRRTGRRLRHDLSGTMLMEFALALPALLGFSLYLMETANLAMAHNRVSQVALNLADNVSRIGVDSSLTQRQIREADVNNSFAAAILQGGNYDITTHGRIILSSLENDSTNGDWIHWQRCKGLLNKTSTYGNENDGAGAATFVGMGDAGNRILPPPNGAIMFVEIFYQYQPIVKMNLFGTTPIEIHHKASYTVRDSRDLSNIYNPSPSVTRSLCTTFSA